MFLYLPIGWKPVTNKEIETKALEIAQEVDADGYILLAEHLRKLVALAYEEAMKATCGGCKRNWPFQIETHNGNNQSGTQLWHVAPSELKSRCRADAIRALKDSLVLAETPS